MSLHPVLCQWVLQLVGHMISTTAWHPPLKTPLFMDCRNLHCMDCRPSVQLQVTRTVSVDQPVPLLLGTPGFLRAVMGLPLHGLQTQSTIPGVTQSSGSVMTTATHPPGIPGYLSPHVMQSSLLPNMQSRSPVISEPKQNTDSPSNKSGTSP